MLDYKIETFLTVTRYMSFTKAAEQLCITQPAVSHHIHLLEEYYGVKLFNYTGKKMSLSDAGMYLYEKACTMNQDANYLKMQIKDIKSPTRKITFGATYSIGEFSMVEPIVRLLNSDPEARLHMVIDNTKELLNKVKQNILDFALIEGNFDRNLYDYQVIREERFIPVCFKDYEFVHKKPEKLADLLDERLILREPGSGTREILENVLGIRNLGLGEFKHVLEVNDMHVIKDLLVSGMGISFLYESVVQKELSAGKIKEIKLSDCEISHDFFLVWNKGSMFANEYQEVVKLMMKEND